MLHVRRFLRTPISTVSVLRGKLHKVLILVKNTRVFRIRVQDKARRTVSHGSLGRKITRYDRLVQRRMSGVSVRVGKMVRRTVGHVGLGTIV